MKLPTQKHLRLYKHVPYCTNGRIRFDPVGRKEPAFPVTQKLFNLYRNTH